MNWTALAGEFARDRAAAATDERRLTGRIDVPTHPVARVLTDRAGTTTIGLIKDLSLTGIGLVLGLAIPGGRRIIVEIKYQGRTQHVLALVAHCRQIDEGKYTVGAEFLEESPANSNWRAVPPNWLAQLPAQS